jgi:hypothetical protein
MRFLVPESFRGGCSFGGACHIPAQAISPADDRLGVLDHMVKIENMTYPSDFGCLRVQHTADL